MIFITGKTKVVQVKKINSMGSSKMRGFEQVLVLRNKTTQFHDNINLLLGSRSKS